jgi:hypothetical protein
MHYQKEYRNETHKQQNIIIKFQMINNNQKSAADDSYIDQALRSLKTSVFELIHNILQYQICPPLLFKALLLVEAL